MITKEQLKDRIYNIIVNLQACKATELVLKFDREMLEVLAVIDLSTVIAELMHEQKIIEVEYELKKLEFRSKSFLLPATATVRINRFESDIEVEFYSHLEAWKKETGRESSSTIMIENAHYQAIIAMGEDVVPVILNYIKDTPDHFSHALIQITGENPCLPENAGKVEENCKSWVEWGKKKGII